MEAEKKKLSIPPKGIRAIIEAIRLGEIIKPSQYAKREAFKKHDVEEAWLNRVLTMIFYDIMKKQGLIDKVIKEIVGVTPLILDPWLRAALRVAVDIALFHDPSSQTIKNLRWKASDFISSRTHPYVGMYFWDLLDKIFEYKPNPKNELEELEWKYLAPSWLIERVKGILGDETEDFFRSVNKRHEWISIRVNTLKANVEEVIGELEEDGVEVVRSERVPTILKIKGFYNFDTSSAFNEGKIIVQEEASAVASIVLDPKPGETVVDLAAPQEEKTTHLAELMKNKGKIYAFDVDKMRMKRLKDFVKRMGIKIVKPLVKDARKAPEIIGEEVADKVLLDAPCTSSGTIGKNPELRWRLREDKINEMSQLQRELLESAARLVKPGGRLLYTTCSIFKEENEKNIRWFLNVHPEFKLVPLKSPYDPGFLEGTMRAWPHRHSTIGFFYALLEKSK